MSPFLIFLLLGCAAHDNESLAERLDRELADFDRDRFLPLFIEITRQPIPPADPAFDTAPAYARAYELARDGDADFLAALMRAGRGPYGRTAEGGEMINEMLWEILEARTQFTLDTLAALPPAEAEQIIGWEYLHPVHDGFDFEAIQGELEAARIPASIAPQIEQVIETVRWHVPGAAENVP